MLSLTAVCAMAQDNKTDMFNPVNYSVTSQMIAPDARSAGMGDVGAATDPDVNSQYWNPAKYPFTISRAGVALNYTPWLRQLVNDMNLAYLSGYYRIGDYSAVSGSVRYFNMGTVYTSSDLDESINPYEMSVDVAFTETVPVVPLSVNTVYVSSPISKVSLTAADTLANVANANNNK